MAKLRIHAIAQRVVLGALIGTFASLHAQASPKHDPGNASYPRIRLPGIFLGQSAMDALQPFFPPVAQSYSYQSAYATFS